MAPMDKFKYSLKSNEAWANYKGYQNDQYFPNLSKGQAPEILWFGCSDSRVPETTILGLQPGDVFTHRNIANILSPTDLSFLSVLEYAVVHVKVKHIVLCGHTFCGGCAGALSDGRIGGVLDAWLTPLKAIRTANESELQSITDSNARAKRLAELSVEKGVEVLMANYIVREAMEQRGLEVHGAVYDIASGKVDNLGFGTDDQLFQKNKSSTGLSKGGATQQGKHKPAFVPPTDFEIVRGNHAMLVFTGEVAELTVR